MRATRRIAAAVLSGLCVVTAASCSSGSPGPGPAQTSLTPAQRLAAAKSQVDAATSVHLALTSSGLPDGSSGIVSADGWGTHPPAFKGTFKVALRGIQADAEITSVGGEVYAKLPLVPGTNKIDPRTFGLPDPATLFSPDHGLTTLLTKTQTPRVGTQVRRGAEVLTTITGTLPGASVVDLFLIGDRSGSYEVSYGLTDGQQLRTVGLTGAFFGSGTRSTYTLALDRYGQPVTITRP
jgi:lipoprotein LprG